MHGSFAGGGSTFHGRPEPQTSLGSRSRRVVRDADPPGDRASGNAEKWLATEKRSLSGIGSRRMIGALIHREPGRLTRCIRTPNLNAQHYINGMLHDAGDNEFDAGPFRTAASTSAPLPRRAWTSFQRCAHDCRLRSRRLPPGLCVSAPSSRLEQTVGRLPPSGRAKDERGEDGSVVVTAVNCGRRYVTVGWRVN